MNVTNDGPIRDWLTAVSSIFEGSGTISKGDCIFGHAKNTMIYDGSICFVCKKCGMTIDEYGYYRWATGHQIEFEDGTR